MGTWDDGLYDNDSALDELGNLVAALDPSVDAAHLAGTVALTLRLLPSSLSAHPDQWTHTIRTSAHLAGLDAAAREALATIAADPEAAAAGRSRSDEVAGVVGRYADGPRNEVLFAVPGVERVVGALVDAAAERLDDAAADDLYEIAGGLAPLGVLLDLGAAVSAARIDAWVAAFDRADAATTDERDFWDVYVDRVRRGFELLRSADRAPPKETPRP